MANGHSLDSIMQEIKQYCIIILKEKQTVGRKDILSKYKSYQFVENTSPDSVDEGISKILKEIVGSNNFYSLDDKSVCPCYKKNGFLNPQCTKKLITLNNNRKECNNKGYTTFCKNLQIIPTNSKKEF